MTQSLVWLNLLEGGDSGPSAHNKSLHENSSTRAKFPTFLRMELTESNTYQHLCVEALLIDLLLLHSEKPVFALVKDEFFNALRF